MFNDVWSLGIILLNLATGRNPWKTATLSDETFCEYLRNPSQFFPSVLPISPEANGILLRMLHVDWTERMTLSEIRQEMEDIETFYIPEVVFDGSQARCPWEPVQGAEEARQQCFKPDDVLKSHWSDDDSQLECDTSFMGRSNRTAYYRDFLLRSFESESDEDLNVTMDMLSSRRSSESSSDSDSPTTPDNTDISFANCYPTERLVDDGKEKGRLQEKERLPTSSSSSLVADMESACSEVTPFFYHSPASPMVTSNALHGQNGVGVEPLPSSESRSSSGVIREATFTTPSITPSPDLFPWSSETSIASQFIHHPYEPQESKHITLNPIKLFTRHHLNGATATRQKRDVEMDVPPDKPPTAHNGNQVSNVRHGARDVRVVQVDDGTKSRKLSPLGSVRYWFSPGKLFF